MRNFKLFAIAATVLTTPLFGAELPTSAIENQSATQVIERNELSSGQVNELGLIHNVGVHIGPAIGNVSTTSVNPSPVTDSTTRMMFGTMATIGLGSIFYVQPEVNFSQKGYEEPVTAPNGDKTVTSIEHDYLEIPLLAKVRTSGTGKIRPFALAGPNFGILLSNSVNVTQTTSAGGKTVSNDQNRAKLASPFSFGAILGAGAEFEIAPNTSIMASLRYSLALTDSENWANADGSTLRRVRNSSVQMLAGVVFAL